MTSLFFLLLIFAFVSFCGSGMAYYKCRYKNGSFGQTRLYGMLFGGFVWADVLIFGIFWGVMSLICFFLRDIVLFLFIYSVFWLVRSIGESLYWFLQQFSSINRNPPHRFLIYKLVKNDSVWFIHQIYWQCMTVVTIITSLYLGRLWFLHLNNSASFLTQFLTHF